MLDKTKKFIQRLVYFLTIGIWKAETRGSLRGWIYNVIKTFILTYRNISFSKLNTQASALTYSSILSMVPLLAVLFAIARGFGLQNLVQNELSSYFAGQKEMLEKSMSFIDKSLEYAQSGIFLGIGIILLLYTVINLISSIEENFNQIWRIKVGRTYFRQFTDYLALLLIAPVYIIFNAGLSIFLGSTAQLAYIGVVASPFLKILPFIITIFLFTFFYIYIPNTKVNFSSALFSGIIAGASFQAFQMIYISGQIWISKYNTIYGSFAALPLLLLWMQLSWFIMLIGVELGFSYQNISKFSFEKESGDVSRRYKDFVLLMITSLITKRFETGGTPYTANELSEDYKIPTRLTSDSLYFLEEIGIIRETPSSEDSVPAYIPAIDINKISVSYLFDKVDSKGSETFDIDTNSRFANQWNTIVNIRKTIEEAGKDILLKDL
jgi:membrane protein